MTPVAYALDFLQGNNVTAGNFLPTLVVIKQSFIEQKNGGKIISTVYLLLTVF
jgi:hypothetical protein